MNVVFTGTLTMSRSRETVKFKNFGINVQNAITKSTNFLIKGDEPGSAKINKANQYGIQIVSEKEFFAILEEEYPEYFL